MTPEEFINTFEYLPSIYYDGFSYSINAHYYGIINVKEPIFGNTVFECLNKLGKEICEQKGIEYVDSESTGKRDVAKVFNVFGTKLRVSNVDMPFLNVLREDIQPFARIELMNLTEGDLKEYLSFQLIQLKDKCKDLLSRKWLWRMDSEPVKLDGFITELHSINDLKKIVSSKKVTSNELKYIIEIFEGINAEVKEVEA